MQLQQEVISLDWQGWDQMANQHGSVCNTNFVAAFSQRLRRKDKVFPWGHRQSERDGETEIERERERERDRERERER